MNKSLLLLAMWCLAGVWTARAVSITVHENSATRTHLTITWDDPDVANGQATYFDGAGTVTGNLLDSSVYLANGQTLIVGLEADDFTALPGDDNFSLVLIPSPDSYPLNEAPSPTHGDLTFSSTIRSVTYDYQVASVPDLGSVLGLLSGSLTALAVIRRRVLS